MGSYPGEMESRLISPVFVVPAANQNPRLRFWQWFSFAGAAGYPYYDNGSYGYVEIEAGTSGWERLATFSGSSGVWSEPSIDLSGYAGQSVQVAFHFHSTHNTSSGWFVDQVTLVTGPITTLAVNVPVGFESGLGDWSVDNGVWAIGTPTVGPGAAYAGTNCAGTALAGSYPGEMESRLISPTFVVPAANQNPRLRFWQWFSFAGAAGYPYYDNGSYGYVEIEAGTNGWQTVTPGYVNSSGEWTEPSIDLSGYAGQSVQVAFHFHSTHNTAAGWFVDDVTLETGTVQTLLANVPQSFEGGLGDWSAESGSWQVGVPSNANGPGKAYDGTNCAAVGLTANYASDVESRLISPVFVVPAANQNPRLRFWQWFS